MFKKLKEKIVEEVKQSPLKFPQLTQNVVSPTSSSVIEPSSNDNFSIGEDCEDTPHSSPTKEGFQAVDLRDVPSPLPLGRRSRQSSISSITSDASSLFPIYEMPGHAYNLQSDLESASEMDEGSAPQIANISKQELYHAYLKLQRRYQKYKGRSNDLLNYCRDLDKDNKKHKNVLLECQEKSIRRISELKEQCALEQRAKAHLEEALRNDLEEKDHLIQTLYTKIKLLKENSVPNSNTTGESALIDLSEHCPTESKVQHKSELADKNEAMRKNQEINLAQENIKTEEMLKFEPDNTLPETQNVLTESKTEMQQEMRGEFIQSHLETKKKLEEMVDSLQLTLSEERSKCESETLKGISLSNEIEILQTKLLETENNFEIYKREKQLLGSALLKYESSLKALRERQNDLKQVASNTFTMLIGNISTLSVKYNYLTHLAHDKLQELALITEEKNKILKQNEGLTKCNLENNARIQELTNENEHNLKEINECKLSLEHVTENCRIEVESIETKLLAVKEEEEKTVLQNQQLGENITALHACIQDQCEELNTVRQCSSRHVEEINDLKQSLVDAENKKTEEIDLLNKKLLLANEGKEKVFSDNKELGANITELESRIQELSEELKAIRTGSGVHIQEINNLKQSLVDAENKETEEIDSLNKKLLLANEEKEKVLSDNKELGANITELESRIQELSEELNAVKTGSGVHIQEINNLKQSLVDAESKKTEEIGSLNKKLLLANEEKESVILCNNELTTSTEQLSAYIQELCDELHSVKLKNDLIIKEEQTLRASLEQVKHDSENQILSLNKKLSDAIEERNIIELNCRELTEELSGELCEVKEDRKNRVKELSDASEKFTCAINEGITICANNSKLREDVTQLSAELESMKKENMKHVTEINQLKSVIARNHNVIEMSMSNEASNSSKDNGEIREIECSSFAKLEKQVQLNPQLSNEASESLNNENSNTIKILRAEMMNLKLKNDELQELLNIESCNSRTVIHELNVNRNELEQQLCEYAVSIEEKERKLDELDEQHTEKIKQLAIDFEKQLAEKDLEMQSSQSETFERKEEEERSEVQFLRNQIQDIMEEYQKKNETYEGLLEDVKELQNDRLADKQAMEQQFKDIHLAHENEINETNKKWRTFHKKELEETEKKHKDELSELSREWHWERKDINSNSDERLSKDINNKHEEVPTKELENTSQLAVAAVESGTGSIELLHKQVVALTQDLKEEKQKHRMEVAELNNLLALRQRNPDGDLSSVHDKSIEMEYVRNIMYQYMMGKEPMLLAKVIAAVMKFDPEQTNQIVQKELQKQTLLGQLGIL